MDSPEGDVILAEFLAQSDGQHVLGRLGDPVGVTGSKVGLAVVVNGLTCHRGEPGTHVDDQRSSRCGEGRSARPDNLQRRDHIGGE